MWVKEYKNIHKQGFNFSPRFECKFHDEYGEDGKLEDNCKLDIFDKKKNECQDNDYIENFFGDNINVTAIVGENGSGKSGVLEILTQISYEDNIRNIGSFLYLLKEEEEYKCFTYNLNIKCDFVTSINKPLYGDTIDSRREHNKIKIVLTQNINVSYLNISHFERDKIIKKDKEEDKLIYLGVYHKNNFSKGREHSTRPLYDEFNPSSFHFNQILRVTNLIKIPKYKELIFHHLNIESIYYLVLSYDKESVFYKLNTIEEDPALNITQKDIFELKMILKDEFFKIESDKCDRLLQSLNHIFKNQGELPFKFNFYSKSKTSVYLSGGENTILFYIEKIALLFDSNDFDKEKSTVLLFDEVELYLHPNWQKKIISIILEIFKMESWNKHIQLIMTSHSPFVLSDLPRENIIFLKNGKNDKGINHKQTFGANIHTLLSDSFFMEDGLMGEFAKGKIDEVIDYLNGKEDTKIKNDDEAQKLINIIGEPIVKNQLQRMLDSKRLKKVDEIDAIKKSMKAMQKRLNELEDDKNK